jgi:phosphoribosylaminoimidazole carboxylase (NCAIR synthetase)
LTNKFGLFRPFFSDDPRSPIYKFIHQLVGGGSGGDLTVTSEMITMINEVIDDLDLSEEYENYDVVKSPQDKTVSIIADRLIKKMLERRCGIKDPDQKFVNDTNNSLIQDIKKEDTNIERMKKEMFDYLLEKKEGGEEGTFT